VRIAHVTAYFQPRVGYQETYLARKQQEMGHEVHIVTSDRYMPFPAYRKSAGVVLGDRITGVGTFQEEGVTVRRLPCFFEYSQSSVVILRGLKRKLEEIRPDVVHSHNIFTLLPFMTACFKSSGDYALVYDTHASTFNTNLTDTLPKRIYHFFFQKLMMPVIRNSADAIIAIGESEQLLACREFGLSPEQVPIIYLGADVELFKFDKGKRRQVRESMGISDDDVLLIHAGKLTPNKDVHVLLQAVTPLMRENEHLKLLVVGGGDKSYLASLRRIIREGGVLSSVIFQDFVPSKELPGFYSTADISVWPGNFSNTILEGMATGLPVILPEVVSEGHTNRHLLTNHNGLFFQRGNTAELRACIRRLAQDGELRGEMGRRSRELVERELSWTAIAKQFLQIYEKALNSRRCS